MFIDASALVAVLKNEPEAPVLVKAMEAAKGPLRISPVVRLEAALALVRTMREQRGDVHSTAEDFETAQAMIAELIETLGAREMHITESMGTAAIEALGRYGKVVGHPARLNLGDALSYACARAFHAPLLYKGDDFARTDLA